jgi:UDP-glucuronate 4-epimerase
METILVTGGAGFIGSHVCDALLSMNKKVICVDNLNDYYDPNIKKSNIKNASGNRNFSFETVDITQKSDLKKIFEKNKIDKVIHLAARAGVRASFENPHLYEKVNVQGTENLLGLTVAFKISNFIFGSSSSVYGTNKKIPFSEDDQINNIISPYARTKKKAEELCRKYYDKFGLPITCLRLFTVYGPRGRPDMAVFKFTKLIQEGKPIEMYGNGKTKRDYTYISDIVSGILSALEKNLDFQIINLGNSDTVELCRLISVIENETQRKAIIKELPIQEGDVPLTFADISKAKKLLGYNPKIKIEKGVHLFVEWFNSQNIQ